MAMTAVELKEFNDMKAALAAAQGVEVVSRTKNTVTLVPYDPTKHRIISQCENDAVSRLAAINIVATVRVGVAVRGDATMNYANLSEESADLYWDHTKLFA